MLLHGERKTLSELLKFSSGIIPGGKHIVIFGTFDKFRQVCSVKTFSNSSTVKSRVIVVLLFILVILPDSFFRGFLVNDNQFSVNNRFLRRIDFFNNNIFQLHKFSVRIHCQAIFVVRVEIFSCFWDSITTYFLLVDWIAIEEMIHNRFVVNPKSIISTVAWMRSEIHKGRGILIELIKKNLVQINICFF